jgi:hypothetical protein
MRTAWFAACIGTLTIAGFAATARPGGAPAVVRFLGSPRYLLELPPSPTDDDLKAADRILRTLERLATMLDAEFVKAGVVKEKDVPKADAMKKFETQGPERLADAPKTPVRWSVRTRETRADLEELCKPLQMTVNTEGTAFFCNGRDAFLGTVLGGGGPSPKDLLGWGTLQFVHHRAELWYARTTQPRGACVPIGLTSFARWSHVKEGADFPAEFGGIDEDYASKLEKRIAEHDATFPSLAELFAKTPKDFDADPNTFYGAAALFAEFLWEFSPESRVHFIRALHAYGLSGRPVAEFPLQTIADEEKTVWKSAKDLEDAFRKFAVEQSPAVNARKRGGK